MGFCWCWLVDQCHLLGSGRAVRGPIGCKLPYERCQGNGDGKVICRQWHLGSIKPACDAFNEIARVDMMCT